MASKVHRTRQIGKRKSSSSPTTPRIVLISICYSRLWPTAYSTSGKPLVSHVQALNAVRKVAISKNNNFLSTAVCFQQPVFRLLLVLMSFQQAKFIPQTSPSTIAVSKPPLLTLLTNTGSSGTGSTSWTIPSSSGLFQHNDVLVDALTCKTVSPNSSGDLVVQVEGGSPKVSSQKHKRLFIPLLHDQPITS